MQQHLSFIVLICSVLPFVPLCQASIKVGLYNYIPDLNDDGLQTYKNMVQTEFQIYCEAIVSLGIELDCSVDAVVNTSVYDPYGDLSDYFENQNFDILEIDTGYNLGALVEQGSIVPVHSIDEGLLSYIDEQMFESAVQAVTVDTLMERTVYALPTLLCGNFITSIDPATTEQCPINLGAVPYGSYKAGLTNCSNNMAETYNTLIMGKMYNAEGGYLPDIYLDGYVDIYGKESLAQGMRDLLEGVVDAQLCERLQWFIGNCIVETINPNMNKCDGTILSGDGVNYEETVFNQIIQNKNLLMFSFSEKLSDLLKTARESGSTRQPYSIASVSFGDEHSYLLQYVDGLVTGKTQWENADYNKREVIRLFNRFFIDLQIRRQVTLGTYLEQPENTYLIIPNKEFYEDASLPTIYKQMLPFLISAVPAPYISSEDRETMLGTLTGECVPGLFNPAAQKKKKKTEL